MNDTTVHYHGVDRNGHRWTKSREEIIAEANRAGDAILAECARLQNAIPYGLCYQIPLSQLQKMTIEEAREWNRRWHDETAVSHVPAVSDVLAVMRQHGMSQDDAIRFLGGQP